jgi:hypothetical protein
MDQVRIKILGNDAKRSSDVDRAAACLWLALETTTTSTNFSKLFVELPPSGKNFKPWEALRFVPNPTCGPPPDARAWKFRNLDGKMSRIGRGMTVELAKRGPRIYLPKEAEDIIAENCRDLVKHRKYNDLRILWNKGSFYNPDIEGRRELVRWGHIEKATYVEYLAEKNSICGGIGG